MRRIVDFIKRFDLFCYNASALLLVFVGLITFFDVIGRYLRHPIPGTFELSQIALACMIFLTIAHTQAIKGHIFLDFSLPLPPRVQDILDMFLMLVSLFVMGVFTWQSVRFILSSYESGEWSDYLHLPLFAVKIFLFIGGLTFCLQLIIDIMERFQKSERTTHGDLVD